MIYLPRIALEINPQRQLNDKRISMCVWINNDAELSCGTLNDHKINFLTRYSDWDILGIILRTLTLITLTS